MPIKVTCACGQSFAAKDELGGKTVRCPKCAQPLKIPSPATPAAASAPQRSSPPGPSAASQAGSLFDDVGLKAAPVGGNLCPGCAQPLAPNAILCIKCGYNVKLGRKMQTVSSSSSGPAGDGGHGDVATVLLAKAAESIDDEIEEERKKTSEGMPWWAYLAGIIAVVGFMIVMMMVPTRIALAGAGILLILGGVLLNLYSFVRVVIIAFMTHPLHGLGILIFDIGLITILFFADSHMSDGVRTFVRMLGGSGWFLYCFAFPDECGPYIAMYWISKGMHFVGGTMILAALFLPEPGMEDDARLPSPPPRQLVSRIVVEAPHAVPAVFAGSGDCRA